jgi:hypothetical protein
MTQAFAPAQTNRPNRYRPSPNRQYAMGHPSPTPGMQSMYPYGDLPQHGQQHHQQQGMQPMSRPSPPQSTWAVPQTHPSYYAAPQGPNVGSREDQRQLMGRQDVMTSQPTVTSSVVYSNSMTAPHSLATTNYFPGVIDTSKLSRSIRSHKANRHRFMGPESMRRARVFPRSGF